MSKSIPSFAHLAARFGHVEEFTDVGAGGARAVWQLDEGGDGVILVRAARSGVAAIRAFARQLADIEAYLSRAGLQPRMLVASVESGPVQFDLALGLQRTVVAVAGTDCTWVAAADLARLSRRGAVVTEFLVEVADAGARLHLADWGRAVDHGRDNYQLDLHNYLNAREAALIKQRWQNALQRDWIDAGRGWPGRLPFGFARDTEGRPVVDKRAWRTVQKIFELRADGLTLAQIRKRVSTWRRPVSAAQVRKVLVDSRYRDGSWSIRFNGEMVPMPPIMIPEPIDPEILRRASR